MRLFNRQSQNIRSSLLGIAAMTLFQLLILFAIGAAVIRYLEWSSDAAQAEFINAIETAFNPGHAGESSTPSQPVRKQTGCNRKG
jgi:hypothetical protein